MTAHMTRDPTLAETVSAAARLTGSPAEIAARLRAALDLPPLKAVPREGEAAKRERFLEERRRTPDVAAMRYRLAADFAEARGWVPTTAPLAARQVARRAPAGSKWHRNRDEWAGHLPSPAFFRTADGRAAAAVGHLPAEIAETASALAEAWAVEQDLAVTFPDDFPSWADPVRARIVVFEPLASEAQEPAPPAQDAPSADRAARSSGQAPTVPGQPDPAPADDVHPEPAPSTAPTLPEMRPVVPIDLAGIAPRDLSGEVGPDFDLVAPTDLLVDEAYQRGLGPRSLDLIRRIVRTWSWAKFKPPVCVRVEDRLHVIDGQHTAIAAASHGGIPIIPVVVVAVPELSDRAAAFVSHATNRLQATALQIHRAALVAGDEEAVTLDAVCRRAGADLLPFAPSDGRYAPRQTVAVVGLRRLIARRGPDKAAEILGALAAADLAPIAGDHVRLGEVLLCDPAYAEAFDPERLTAAMRGLTAKVYAEARELAIAQRLPAWRALAAVLARNSRAAASRKRASA